MFDGSRRAFLAGAIDAAALALPAIAGAAQAPPRAPEAPAVDRDTVRGLAPFDDLLDAFVRDQQVPGAQLAVASEGRLVHARGFGWASREAQQAVEATTLFRIASLSKPITATAVLQLAERSKLALDSRVWELLELAGPADARFKRVTIRHLLQHTGGWDSEANFDPMFRPAAIARELKVAAPARPVDIVRYMLGRPLDFDPGSRFAYSNFGYCLLGRVIERASATAYEQYVRREVLAPLGIRRMRLGRTSRAQRAEGEAVYYAERNHRGERITGKTRDGVPLPYGAWSLEAMDSHGGWLASAVDVVRFACALDARAEPAILRAGSIETMFARPDGPAGYATGGSPKPVYYGCGWRVRTVGRRGQFTAFHTGSLDGTSTLLVRRHDGRIWAVLFNARTAPDGARWSDKIDPLLHRAADRVRRWPDVDRFQQFL